MRVLAVDHGAARAGCAVSDATGTIARPLGVIEPAEPGAVAKLALEHEVELVVVGLPVSLSGAEGPQAAEARAFCEALEEILDVPVESYDERLTTRLAEHSVRAGASAPADALAAAHLLESYLQAHARASDEVADQDRGPAATFEPEPGDPGREAEGPPE
ncbi:MAG TPA: Holliday junction resolvase RuvX [Solirubrobacterales bacterium]